MTEQVLAPRVSVRGPEDGELLPAGPVVHRVLEDGSTTEGRAGLVECRMPAGWGGPPQHIHHAHDESFFVLTGHVRFRSGSTEHVLGPGSTFVAGMGTPHTFGNADPDEPASLLLRRRSDPLSGGAARRQLPEDGRATAIVAPEASARGDLGE